MGKRPKIEFFREDDLVLAFCGPAGVDGVFRYRLARPPVLRWGRRVLGRDRWEFCPPGTEAWDAYHQKTFLQHRAERCRLDELGAAVPPLPDDFPPAPALARSSRLSRPRKAPLPASRRQSP